MKTSFRDEPPNLQEHLNTGHRFGCRSPLPPTWRPSPPLSLLLRLVLGFGLISYSVVGAFSRPTTTSYTIHHNSSTTINASSPTSPSIITPALSARSVAVCTQRSPGRFGGRPARVSEYLRTCSSHRFSVPCASGTVDGLPLRPVSGRLGGHSLSCWISFPEHTPRVRRLFLALVLHGAGLQALPIVVANLVVCQTLAASPLPSSRLKALHVSIFLMTSLLFSIVAVVTTARILPAPLP